MQSTGIRTLRAQEKHGLDDLLQHQEQLQRRLQAVQQQQQQQAPGQGPVLSADAGRAAAAAEPSAPINPQVGRTRGCIAAPFARVIGDPGTHWDTHS